MRIIAILMATLSSVAAVAFAQIDPGRRLDTPTGWTFFSNVSAATINTDVSAGRRPIMLRRNAANPANYDATLVQNSGSYAQGFWYYYGLDATQVGNFLSANSARLISIEAYDNGAGSPRFNVVMVSNTGSNARMWWWYHGATTAQISTLLTQNNARLVDLHRYVIGGQTWYAAVMYANTGGTALPWGWGINASPAWISDQISTNNFRIIDIQVNNPNAPTFDVVFERNQGQGWWWYYGQTWQGMIDRVEEVKGRLVDFDAYNTTGGTRYVAVILDNANTMERRIRAILHGGTDGVRGFYIRRAGDASPMAEIYGTRPFEPASMIKILHHAYAMNRVSYGGENLATGVTVFQDYTGSCPLDSNPMTLSLSETLRRMMENSDNQCTQTIRARYGQSTLNGYAAGLGLSNTQLNHRIGCGSEAVANPNVFSLRDAARLYELIGTTTTVVSDARRNDLYTRMNDWQSGALPAEVLTIVQQEAAPFGLTNAEIADFRTRMLIVEKGGSYGLSTGGPLFYHQTRGAWAQIPFRDGCDVVVRGYGFGTFVNFASNNTNASNAASTARWELLREPIRAALSDWRRCPADWNCDGSVDFNDFLAFLNDYNAGNRRADLNGDGVVDFNDFLAFLNLYNAPC
jgi:hypothetical protein